MYRILRIHDGVKYTVSRKAGVFDDKVVRRWNVVCDAEQELVEPTITD